MYRILGPIEMEEERAIEEPENEQAESLNGIMKEFNWADKGYYSGLGAILPGVSSFVLEGPNRKVFDFSTR